LLIQDYRISLWNYFWYYTDGSLEDVIGEIRAAGRGIELWDRWKADRDLYQPKYHARLRAATEGMKVSLHSRGCQGRDDHLAQFETARAVGADVVVVHVAHFPGGDGAVDLALMKEMAGRCRDAGMCMALENVPGANLPEAFDTCGDALGFCFDTGHREGRADFFEHFLGAFGDRLVHIHLQDPEPRDDHWELGTGVNTAEEWKQLKAHLRKIDYAGAAVFEIRPRRPDAIAERSIRFLEGL